MTARWLAGAAVIVALSGCSVSSKTNLDPNFQACIDAGGDYREPVDDGIGFACDLPDGGQL